MYRTYQVAASGVDVHHDALLSNVAVAAFDTGEDGFIGERLFPAVTVGKRSDRYAIIDKGNFLRIPDARRAPKTEARRVEFQVSSAPYFAENWALASEIALEDLENADVAFQLRENNIKLVVSNLRRAQEERIALIVTSATNMGSGTLLTGTNQWSDYINSNPLSDVATARAFIRQTTGLAANTAVLDPDTFEIVSRHPDLLDLYKYTRSGQLDMAQVAAAFKVDNLWIGNGIKENALEDGTTSMTNIWGKNCVIAHVEGAAGLQTRTLGLRMQWRPGSFPAPLAASTRRESGPGTKNIEIVQAEHYQDERLVAANLGYLIATTVA